MSTSIRPEPETPKLDIKNPGTLPRVLAWVGLFWGVLCIFTGLFGEPSLAGTFAMLLIGLAFVIPSAWWLHCAAHDKKAIEHFEDTVRANEHLSQFLTAEDDLVLQGMSGLQPPRKKDRRWPIVAVASAILFVVGAVIMPADSGASAGETGADSTTSETTTVKTSTSNSPTTSTRPEPSTTRNTEAEESKSRAAQESKRLEEERVEKERRAREEEQRIRAEEEQKQREAEEAERVRIAEQERIQSEQQQQQFVAPAPVPEPAPSVSYANCTDVWNRLGRPIYPSDPGYTSGPRKLDGNSDGVGCESDPR